MAQRRTVLPKIRGLEFRERRLSSFAISKDEGYDILNSRVREACIFRGEEEAGLVGNVASALTSQLLPDHEDGLLVKLSRLKENLPKILEEETRVALDGREERQEIRTKIRNTRLKAEAKQAQREKLNVKLQEEQRRNEMYSDALDAPLDYLSQVPFMRKRAYENRVRFPPLLHPSISTSKSEGSPQDQSPAVTPSSRGQKTNEISKTAADDKNTKVDKAVVGGEVTSSKISPPALVSGVGSTGASSPLLSAMRPSGRKLTFGGVEGKEKTRKSKKISTAPGVDGMKRMFSENHGFGVKKQSSINLKAISETRGECACCKLHDLVTEVREGCSHQDMAQEWMPTLEEATALHKHVPMVGLCMDLKAQKNEFLPASLLEIREQRDRGQVSCMRLMMAQTETDEEMALRTRGRRRIDKQLESINEGHGRLEDDCQLFKVGFTQGDWDNMKIDGTPEDGQVWYHYEVEPAEVRWKRNCNTKYSGATDPVSDCVKRWLPLERAGKDRMGCDVFQAADLVGMKRAAQLEGWMSEVGGGIVMFVQDWRSLMVRTGFMPESLRFGLENAPDEETRSGRSALGSIDTKKLFRAAAKTAMLGVRTGAIRQEKTLTKTQIMRQEILKKSNKEMKFSVGLLGAATAELIFKRHAWNAREVFGDNVKLERWMKSGLFLDRTGLFRALGEVAEKIGRPRVSVFAQISWAMGGWRHLSSLMARPLLAFREHHRGLDPKVKPTELELPLGEIMSLMTMLESFGQGYRVCDYHRKRAAQKAAGKVINEDLVEFCSPAQFMTLLMEIVMWKGLGSPYDLILTPARSGHYIHFESDS